MKVIRAGMIGLDTSHVPAFAKVFNSPKAAGDVEGIRVVAGYPGGTDIPASKDRVAKFTDQIRAMEIAIVDTIPSLLGKVDVVMLGIWRPLEETGHYTVALTLIDAMVMVPGAIATALMPHIAKDLHVKDRTKLLLMTLGVVLAVFGVA